MGRLRMNEHNYLDKEIARLIKETKDVGASNKGFSSVDIQSGVVVIRGERVYFGRKTLMDGKVILTLPRDFQKISPEDLYRPEARPDEALVNEKGSIHITMAHLAKKVSNDAEVETHKNEVRQILQTMNSSVEWLEDDVKNINGRLVAYFEFVTPMLGTSVYNLSFFLGLEKQILTGSFTCSDQELKGWKLVFHQMLDSIELVIKEEIPEKALVYKDYSNCYFDQGLYALYKGKEYLCYKLVDGFYRLISNDQKDCENNGFYPQDGMFKKKVGKEEISAAYERKFTLFYRKYSFEMGQENKTGVQLIMRKCDFDLAVQLGLKRAGYSYYEKWVAKSEIEKAVENRLPVEGFIMPNVSSAE